MKNPMTQEDFDRLIAEQEESNKKRKNRRTGSAYCLTVTDENLVDVDITKHNLSGVDFLRCHISQVKPLGNEKLHTRFKDCTISRVDIDGVVGKLYFTDCRIEGITCRKSIYATISLADCMLGSATIQDSDLNFTCRRTILREVRIDRCVGRIVVDFMSGYKDALKLKDNSFTELDVHDTPLMGRITTPMWDVSYCADLMRIGCQQHTIEAWRNFTPAEINAMDANALSWWLEWKEAIFAVVNKDASRIRGLASQVKDLEEVTEELRVSARSYY